MKKLILILLLTIPGLAFAQGAKDTAGGADRWNITGPSWYETKCGHIGMTLGVGIGEGEWVKPCSIPVRVCVYERMTINFPALPDDPSCTVGKEAVVGKLQRTELRRWD